MIRIDILLTIKRGSDTALIRFPCTEKELASALCVLGTENATAATLFVDTVQQPQALEILAGRFLNLDEINYFAKRMDSFDGNETIAFFEAMKEKKYTDLKDLINLTFNMNQYALIRDISSYEKIGKAYLLQTEGCLSADDEQHSAEYRETGRRIMENGYRAFTEHGMMFYDPEAVMTEVYDGTVFPDYDWRGDALASAEIRYNGKSETVYLPNEDIAISKAINRLETDSLQHCTVGLELLYEKNGPLADILRDAVAQNDLTGVNKVLVRMKEHGVSTSKISAMVSLTDAHTVHDLEVLIGHSNDFIFEKDIQTTRDVGRYFVENFDDFNLPVEMWDYFDFEGFGREMMKQNDGAIIGKNFVFHNGMCSLQSIRNQFDAPTNDPVLQM